MSRTAAVVAAGLVLLAGGLALATLRRTPRQAGSNGTPTERFVAQVAPGGRLCQAGETLPADTGSLQLRIGTYGRPGGSLALTARNGVTVVARGGLPPGWRQGDVRIPVRGSARRTSVTVCLRNGATKLAVAGQPQAERTSATLPGGPAAGRVRIDYFRKGRASLVALAPTIGERYEAGSADVLGPWSVALALALVAGTVAGAGVLLVRDAPR